MRALKSSDFVDRTVLYKWFEFANSDLQKDHKGPRGQREHWISAKSICDEVWRVSWILTTRAMGGMTSKQVWATMGVCKHSLRSHIEALKYASRIRLAVPTGFFETSPDAAAEPPDCFRARPAHLRVK